MAQPPRSLDLVTVTAQRPARAGITPAFSLVVDGQDRTAVMSRRLLAISLVDHSGDEADTAELTFDDFDDRTRSGGAIETPRTGAWLELGLGYKETGVVPMGRFIVDETEFTGPPDLLIVRARSADLRGSADSRWKAQKSRSHRATRIGDLVSKIATEHGLNSAVDPDLRDRPIAHLDQTSESDLHFLTRLARREGATFALKGSAKGSLVIFARAGAPRAASGAETSRVEISRAGLTNWQLTLATRGDHGSVVARWRDRAAAKIVSVTAGTGEPKRTLRHVYESQSAAERAAEAELSRLGRASKGALNFELSGTPTLAAGAKLTLQGVRAGIDGDWIARTVDHRLDWAGGGYTSRVEGEKA